MENRRFLGRAVRYVAEQGINQFLDIGAGLPTQDNVHQIAQRVTPADQTPAMYGAVGVGSPRVATVR